MVWGLAGARVMWCFALSLVLQVVRDHHADVYGIAAHRRRPFALATTSRDTTLRIWDLRSTFPSVQVPPLPMFPLSPMTILLNSKLGTACECNAL
jgi:WD40 repeat protein